MKLLTAPTISFEFFPPKTPEGSTRLYNTAQTLAKWQPDFFSVTFGAGGSTRSGTIETVSTLLRDTKISVAPHLSCVGASREELAAVLAQYKIMGVKRIVALRGDLPSGMAVSGEFKFASQLVALIRELSGDYFHIEVAAYPEIHPQAKSVQDDVLNLMRKYQAGANSAITQYFFNADAYFYYMEQCRALNIDLPIIPGIMPITQYTKLARFSDTCGAEIPRWIRKRLESYGDDLEAIKAFGLEVVYQLCQNLISGGAPGLHFYTLNKAEAAVDLMNQLGLATPRMKYENLVSQGV